MFEEDLKKITVERTEEAELARQNSQHTRGQLFLMKLQTNKRKKRGAPLCVRACMCACVCVRARMHN